MPLGRPPVQPNLSLHRRAVQMRNAPHRLILTRGVSAGMEIAGVSMRVTDDRLGFERGALEALERHCGAKPDASHAEQVLLEAAAERKLPHEVVTGAVSSWGALRCSGPPAGCSIMRHGRGE